MHPCSRKVHTVVTSLVPSLHHTQDARNGGSVDTELFVGELGISAVDENAWYSKMKVGGELIEFKLDTGTEANIIPVKSMNTYC